LWDGHTSPVFVIRLKCGAAYFVALIELIKNYSSPKIQVDGEGLLDAYRQLERLTDSAPSHPKYLGNFQMKKSGNLNGKFPMTHYQLPIS
jgi:hypothetical protein